MVHHTEPCASKIRAGVPGVKGTPGDFAPLSTGQASELPLGLWWIPARVSYYFRRAWRTKIFGYPEEARAVLWDLVEKGAIISPSPISFWGEVHYVAVDVDNADPATVHQILEILPEGLHPLVSRSSANSWHIWLVPRDPLPLDQAIRFCSAFRKRLPPGVEVFPTGSNSRCLRWPGQPHPTTGELELFVPLDDVTDTDRLDTPLTLQALRDGLASSDPSLFEARRLRAPGIEGKDLEGRTSSEGGQAGAASSPTSRKQFLPPSGGMYKSSCGHAGENAGPACKGRPAGELLAADERVMRYLFRLAGRKPAPLERPFRCLLHPERRPSASFHRTESGEIMYRDWHHEKYGCPEWLTLGELYVAIREGKLRKLKPHEKARALAEAAYLAGVKTRLTVETEKTLAHITALLKMTGVVKDAPCTNLGVPFEGSLLEKVWAAIRREALLSAQSGYRQVKLSVRFLGQLVGCKDPKLVCQVLNVFVALGVLRKLPRIRGNRFKLVEVDRQELERRWRALGRRTAVTKAVVATCLGPGVAMETYPASTIGVNPEDAGSETQKEQKSASQLRSADRKIDSFGLD